MLMFFKRSKCKEAYISHVKEAEVCVLTWADTFSCWLIFANDILRLCRFVLANEGYILSCFHSLNNSKTWVSRQKFIFCLYKNSRVCLCGTTASVQIWPFFQKRRKNFHIYFIFQRYQKSLINFGRANLVGIPLLFIKEGRVFEILTKGEGGYSDSSFFIKGEELVN